MARNDPRRLLLAAFMALPAWAAAEGPEDKVDAWLTEARKAVPAVDTAKLVRMVDSDRDFILLDVRLPRERQRQGSIDPFRETDIPRGYLEFRAPKKLPDRDARIVLYCGSGKRSLLAAHTLQRMGYADVRNYSGGLTAWQETGHPVAP